MFVPQTNAVTTKYRDCYGTMEFIKKNNQQINKWSRTIYKCDLQLPLSRTILMVVVFLGWQIRATWRRKYIQKKLFLFTKTKQNVSLKKLVYVTGITVASKKAPFCKTTFSIFNGYGVMKEIRSINPLCILHKL